jgi:hypothetical protein
MPNPLPKHPRTCTHIKVTGQRCGSPSLRGEFFCYFHTRVIKGVQQRVDMQLHSMALLEDCESIQLSIMHVVDGLIKGTLDATRARLIIQALRIAARNAKNVRFDTYHEDEKQSMVRQVPDYARQYLIEHPEFGPPIDSQQTKCGAGAPAREADSTAVAEREALTASVASRQNDSPNPNRRTSRKAAKECSPRRKPWVHERKRPSSEGAKETPARSARIRTQSGTSRHRRRRTRQLARPANRLRVRRDQPTKQRCPILTPENIDDGPQPDLKTCLQTTNI